MEHISFVLAGNFGSPEAHVHFNLGYLKKTICVQTKDFSHLLDCRALYPTVVFFHKIHKKYLLTHLRVRVYS